MRLCGQCEARVWDHEAAFCPLDGSPLERRATRGDSLIGTTLFDQFHITGFIGSGATGRVYRAWQRGTEREVAVKLLHPDLADRHPVRQRFLREARAAARLRHPSIVTVHMVGETEEGLPYLVMEHVEGATLEETLARSGPLSPPRAVAIARQIASALAEAHAAGVVHRDLKPANVLLVARRGAAEQVKLLDFGIAKVVGRVTNTEEAVEITREGAIFGTPQYLAPEQACGARIDGRADLYSLGVILYRMLSGRVPFDGSGVAVVLAQLDREPELLGAIAPSLYPRLCAAVMRCLSKAPAGRFSSAEELAEALAISVEPAAPRPAPRRARLLAAGLAIVCAGAAAGGTTALLLRGML
jgi:serine/threonine protein kinase